MCPGQLRSFEENLARLLGSPLAGPLSEESQVSQKWAWLHMPAGLSLHLEAAAGGVAPVPPWSRDLGHNSQRHRSLMLPAAGALRGTCLRPP